MVGRALALAATLMMGAPGLATTGGMVWVELCDTAHPGRRVPLPLDRGDEGSPAQACHAACGLLADRRQKLRR